MNLGKKKALLQCFGFTLFFAFLAYGVRAMIPGFSADSMLIDQSGEELYQLSLGRFVQPLWWAVRGNLTAPPVILFFTVLFLGLSTFLLSGLLAFDTAVQRFFLCGILTTAEAMICSAATYLPWMDVYAAALFLSILGVWLAVRGKHGLLITPLFFCLSLGLYQSYLQTASALMILLLLIRLMNRESAVSVFRSGVQYVLSLLAGLILYAIVLKILLALTGTASSQDYNGIGRMDRITVSQIPALLAGAWWEAFSFFFRADGTTVLPPLLNAFLLLPAAFLCMRKIFRLPLLSVLLSLFLLFILPLGMNFEQILSRGMIHRLMEYSFCFAYVFAFDILCSGISGVRLRNLLAVPFCLMFALLVITSNQMVLKRDLEYASNTSVWIRIFDRIEQTEGYVPGETPVALVGELPASVISMTRPGFEKTAKLQGMRNTYAAAYESANHWYVPMIAGENMNLLSIEETAVLVKSGAADGLAAFPEPGCTRMSDGILILRISK